MNKKLLLPLALGAIAYTFVRTTKSANLATVPNVDLNRYAGKWYEIARLPDWFEKKCASDVAAHYEVLSPNTLKVINECRDAQGTLTRSEGVGRSVHGGQSGKLKVRFAPGWLSWLPAVWGDYWIINLAPDYSYALVGTPDRKYLWVLARAPQMNDSLYRRLMNWAFARGFAVDKLLKTQHRLIG